MKTELAAPIRRPSFMHLGMAVASFALLYSYSPWVPVIRGATASEPDPNCVLRASTRKLEELEPAPQTRQGASTRKVRDLSRADFGKENYEKYVNFRKAEIEELHR